MFFDMTLFDQSRQHIPEIGAWTDTANDMIECALELSVDFAELGDGGGGSGEYVYIG